MTDVAGEVVVSLVNELMTAIGLLEHGLAGLQAIDAANDFYQLPLLLLANGSERLCKCVLILKHQVDAMQFPDQATLKKWGHDVEVLTSLIVEACYPDEYLRKPIAVEDHMFLRSDPLLREVVSCLSHYGSGGRYYDLDVICGVKAAAESPESAWQRFEMSIVKSDATVKKMLSDP